MSRTSEPTQEYVVARTAKLAEPYNNKNVETALTIIVDTGLDYSDYGIYHPPFLLPSLLPTPINIKSHETKGVNALNMTQAAFTIFLISIFGSLESLSLKIIAISGNKEFTLGNGSGVRQKVGVNLASRIWIRGKKDRCRR
ncbi:uncharacterized protein K444DRAFT_634788 [Hyaloscypha bicolor E]|uniref:Uncharacterized protein n=1 Tax=Hyaloscypha bicolor E TaxID=1095630 RepID=A0A2J6STH2_9HELO|nr:uncharacterized protein K444DRAFT_634788 [Hyaloscypha bicolor E]PMD54003.1 hypothetical protein K444DRAFT_634788 [Hyaloscypha bicolor E]